MDFGFEKIMDFAMDIVNLNLAKMVGKVMDKIIFFQIQKLNLQKRFLQYFCIKKSAKPAVPQICPKIKAVNRPGFHKR